MPMDYECDEVLNKFLQESGRISPAVFRKNIAMGPWISAIPRQTWEDGMGLIVSNTMWERTLPANEGDEWVDVANSDGADIDACTPTPEILNWGQTTRSMRVQRRNIQTPDICVEDLRTDFLITKFLNNLVRNLSVVSNYVWENRDRDETIRLSDHKITETGNAFDMTETTFDAADPPTSRLTNGTLERVYDWLMADGAAADGAAGRTTAGNAPVFNLFTDRTTSRDLIRQDPELRNDFRYANPEALLNIRGEAISYNGFRHVIDPYPARYNIVGGAYVRVQPFSDPVATTKGVKQELNQAYLYAAYQDHVVQIPSVWTQRIPKPIGQLGPLKFNPVNYTGDFKFLVILDKLCNPRGTKGFFDAIFASASEPGNTYLGWVIRALNCPPIRKPQTSCYS